jgi:hypothetical protein
VALKIAPATAEEYTFAQEVNRKLASTGASVHAFTRVNTEDDTRTYGLILQCGAKRETITADTPFCYDPPDDVVARMQRWMAGVTAGDRWTTDLEKADG